MIGNYKYVKNMSCSAANKIILSFFWFFVLPFSCFSQDINLRIDNNYGFLFFDVIQSHPESDFYGYHLAGEVSMTLDAKISDHFSIETKFGYQNIYFLISWFDFPPSKGYFSNGILGTSAKYTTTNNIYSYRLGLTNYALMNKDLHHRLSKRYYLTMDAGSSIKLSKRFFINLSTPFTLVSPFRGSSFEFNEKGELVEIATFVEITGLMLGFSYLLN